MLVAHRQGALLGAVSESLAVESGFAVQAGRALGAGSRCWSIRGLMRCWRQGEEILQEKCFRLCVSLKMYLVTCITV